MIDSKVIRQVLTENNFFFLVAYSGNAMKQQGFKGKLAVLAAPVICCCCLLLPANAWALQSHGAPEGLYVHQMAHVFVALAMAYWFWDIRRSSFKGKGWRYLQIFCVLMLAWNIVAFTGHAVAVSLDVEHISTTTGYLSSRIVGPMDLHKIIYYMTRFDHVVIVPALFFLFLGVRSLYRDVEAQHNGEEKK